MRRSIQYQQYTLTMCRFDNSPKTLPAPTSKSFDQLSLLASPTIIRNWPIGAVRLDPVGRAAVEGTTDQKMASGDAAAVNANRDRWMASNPGQEAVSDLARAFPPEGYLPTATGSARYTALLHRRGRGRRGRSPDRELVGDGVALGLRVRRPRTRSLTGRPHGDGLRTGFCVTRTGEHAADWVGRWSIHV